MINDQDRVIWDEMQRDAVPDELEQEKDTKTVPVSEVYAVCEDIEDEAYGKLEIDDLDPGERGYWRGQKIAAKTIRKAIGAIT